MKKQLDWSLAGLLVLVIVVLFYVQHRQHQRITQLWLELDAQRAWIRSVELRVPEVLIHGMRTEIRRVK